jgi:trimethylamine-N-oxide reductase (cytochrome c)
MENDCLYADIVLPTTSTFEDDDMEYEQGAYNTLLYMEKCIPPVGESKSDYEALIPIAEKLGIREEFTGGKTVQEWMKFIWENSGVANDITWEDLKEKQYFAAGANPEWVNVTPYLLDFYNDPDTNPLPTPSGKLEIQSSRLLESFPDDIERPPVPHWVPGGSEEDGYLHDEFRDGERGEHYPLLMVCNTPKWRLHAQCDDIPWIREISKIKGPDGYMYEPLWVNPVDAVARGLETGDVVKIYNDRGATLAAVSVNERTIAGGVI